MARGRPAAPESESPQAIQTTGLKGIDDAPAEKYDLGPLMGRKHRVAPTVHLVRLDAIGWIREELYAWLMRRPKKATVSCT